MGNNSCACNRNVSNDSELTMRDEFYRTHGAEIAKSANLIQNKVRTFNAHKTVVANLQEIIEHKVAQRLTVEEFSKLIHSAFKKLNVLSTKKNQNKTQVVKLEPVKLTTEEFYFGEWNLQGQRQGQGTLVSKDLDLVYSGGFEADKFSGFGVYVKATGENYQGDWLDGAIHGTGSFTQTDGTKYSGVWLKDLRHGYGEETYADGSVYRGNFVDNEKEGPGSFTWADGSVYKGDFANSLFEGDGEIKWADKRSYKGTWVQGKIEGSGTSTWANGHVYCGSYKNGLKWGNGKYTWTRGATYEGQWLNNKPHGTGVYVNGTNVYTGVWRFGRVMSVSNANEATDESEIASSKREDRNEIMEINAQIAEVN